MGKIRNDIILIIIVLALIITSFILMFTLRKTNSLYVNIYKESNIIYSIPITEDKVIELDGYESHMIIEIKDESVRVKESGCHNQICVNVGFVKNFGETITCMPNLVYIKIGDKIDI